MADLAQRKKLLKVVPPVKNYSFRLCRVNIIISILFCATIIVTIITSMKESDRLGMKYIKYSSVPGYFCQDDPETNYSTFDWTNNFGLKDPDWSKFARAVDQLNKDAGLHTKYKVLFLGRHGEGYHNVAEAFYGTKAWDCYYSLLDGNGTSSWADAYLTPQGIAQAQLASSVWSTALSIGLPPPQSFYSSPLTRCLQTALHTFATVSLPNISPPITFHVQELLRETIGAHTCDRRSTRAAITNFFARDTAFQLDFEEGFKDADELWDAELRELPAGEDRRSVVAMDALFHFDHRGDPSTWISISAHSGIIGSLLRVLGHRPFRLSTGGVIPVLVKAELVHGERAPIEGDSWEGIVPCKHPPKPASEGTGGLVKDTATT